MAIEDIFKGFDLKGFDGGATGLAVGIGTALLAPIVIPVLTEIGKPLTKAAIKEGILLYEKSKEAMAEMTEVFEDLVAEAKAELAQDQKESGTKLAEEPQIIVPITD
jgi:hypothetical protein